jgi:hypothetical protein
VRIIGGHRGDIYRSVSVTPPRFLIIHTVIGKLPATQDDQDKTVHLGAHEPFRLGPRARRDRPRCPAADAGTAG